MIDPCRASPGGLPQCVFVADRAGEIRAASYDIRAFGKYSGRDAGVCTIGCPDDIAGIDQRKPVQDTCIDLVASGREHLDVSLQIAPGYETMVARHAGLRVMQPKPKRYDLVVAPAGGNRQRRAERRDRLGVTVSVKTDQVFGLFLQMLEIQSIGRSVHWKPPCLKSPKARNTGCTKALGAVLKLQVGSTLPAGPGATCIASKMIGRSTEPINRASGPFVDLTND